MKTIMKTLSVFFLASMTIVAANAQIQSMGNSKINTDFTKYKSFTWARSDANANAVIENAIYNELEGRGFRENPGHGDLIVVYRVLSKQGKIHGYNNDSPLKTIGGKQVRQPSDMATFNVAPGTMMVNIIDASTDETVWTGFSSGMIHQLPESSEISNDEMELREAVHSIFAQFKYDATGTQTN